MNTFTSIAIKAIFWSSGRDSNPQRSIKNSIFKPSAMICQVGPFLKEGLISG
ncbi:hypothetical protein LEP1GSC016_3653 [Leptospira borgpetersenii serovar Hardjo-bovis str. Sponselee]|uniref:Uncharacterized protein n=1 Tax=Leptospira borgpetersenii serovar Hardjo-bovis str. Sponselee TaxID=1303729 RepID=M6BEJ9_LEPBO|nr:hypothetical protein LEP1GSC016_3653 [Leptospira borgpetersenii serovar Hardjo-bovis str. Sponselee]